MSTAERETIAMGRLELAGRDEPGTGSLAEALSSVEGQLGARTGAQAEAARAKKYAAQQQRAAQAAYEEELLREVRRMQQIAKLEVVARRQAEREITERREREARRRAEDQARRTRALERERSEAEAERAAAREWDEKQAEALARQAEVEAQKLAVIERERQERARALRVARDKQEAGTAKAAADRVAQAALQLRMDEAKREALLARLEGRRAERQAEGARKAEVALARVCRALASRTEAADEADAAYAHKAAMQDEGAAQLTLQQRTRAEEGRERVRAPYRRRDVLRNARCPRAALPFPHAPPRRPHRHRAWRRSPPRRPSLGANPSKACSRGSTRRRRRPSWRSRRATPRVTPRSARRRPPKPLRSRRAMR